VFKYVSNTEAGIAQTVRWPGLGLHCERTGAELSTTVHILFFSIRLGHIEPPTPLSPKPWVTISVPVWVVCEATRLPTYGHKLKNSSSCTCTCPALFLACLAIKYKDNFTFYI